MGIYKSFLLDISEAYANGFNVFLLAELRKKFANTVTGKILEAFSEEQWKREAESIVKLVGHSKTDIEVHTQLATQEAIEALEMAERALASSLPHFARVNDSITQAVEVSLRSIVLEIDFLKKLVKLL